MEGQSGSSRLCVVYKLPFQLGFAEPRVGLGGGPVREACDHAGPAHTLWALSEMPYDRVMMTQGAIRQGHAVVFSCRPLQVPRWCGTLLQSGAGGKLCAPGRSRAAAANIRVCQPHCKATETGASGVASSWRRTVACPPHGGEHPNPLPHQQCSSMHRYRVHVRWYAELAGRLRLGVAGAHTLGGDG